MSHLDECLTITEAAKELGVTGQAIYTAIRKGRLKAFQLETSPLWRMRRKELNEYLASKFSRAHSMYKGKKVYDKELGEYSVREAGEFLGMPAQHLYHAIRTGTLPYIKKGCAYVLYKKELEEYKRSYLEEISRKYFLEK